MEALYLLCSIFTTCLTTLTHSLILLLRRVILPWSAVHGGSGVSLYQGTVWHERRRPVHHSFRYTVRYALFDLDHAPHPPPDHLSANEARHYSETNGSVLLLTIPPSVGYEQNPLSIYYCYDVEGSELKLKKCIAEVTNTPWGERVLFLFDPNGDTVGKPLHVSPFMDMLGNWCIKTNSPGDMLVVAITVQHPNLGDCFTATLTAKKVSSPDMAADHGLFFWLMPHKVALWIYWHAFKLWWEGVPFIQHPRYCNIAYRQEATQRDRKLMCCPSFASTGQKNNDNNCMQVEGSTSHLPVNTNVKDHSFIWRDAKWPWC